MKIQELGKIKKYEQFVLVYRMNLAVNYKRYNKDLIEVYIEDNKVIFDFEEKFKDFSKLLLLNTFIQEIKDSKLIKSYWGSMTFEVPADPVKKTFKVEYADPSEVFIRYIPLTDLQDAKEFLRDSCEEQYGWRPAMDTMEQESFIDKDGVELFTISYDTQDWETEEDSIND